MKIFSNSTDLLRKKRALVSNCVLKDFVTNIGCNLDVRDRKSQETGGGGAQLEG
jgi:hypothetical protein